MLIKGLLDLIYTILDFILFTELPAMPEFFSTLLNEVTSYLVMGLGVLSSFLGFEAMAVLYAIVSLILSANFFYFMWSLVFWILRKIPMLNIRE